MPKRIPFRLFVSPMSFDISILLKLVDSVSGPAKQAAASLRQVQAQTTRLAATALVFQRSNMRAAAAVFGNVAWEIIRLLGLVDAERRQKVMESFNGFIVRLPLVAEHDICRCVFCVTHVRLL